MDERIKKLRKALNMTQQEFADKLHVARNNIAGYETGRRSPSEAVIALICREYLVNEDWLRNGTGGLDNMFIHIPEEDEIAVIVSDLLSEENEFYDLILGIMRTYQKLSPASKEIFNKAAADLKDNIIAEKEKREE